MRRSTSRRRPISPPRSSSRSISNAAAAGLSAAAAAAQQVPQAQQPQQPQQLQPQAANDPYAKWGVSRYKADGTKKTRTELDEEMRQKRLEYERQKNPNYGTIFNLGSVWSDG